MEKTSLPKNVHERVGHHLQLGDQYCSRRRRRLGLALEDPRRRRLGQEDEVDPGCLRHHAFPGHLLLAPQLSLAGEETVLASLFFPSSALVTPTISPVKLLPTASSFAADVSTSTMLLPDILTGQPSAAWILGDDRLESRRFALRTVG